MAQPLMASQIRDALDDLINDHGDRPCFQADSMEPQWRNGITMVEFEHDRETILITATD